MTIASKAANGGEAARDTLHEAAERIDEATRDARKTASEKIHNAAAAGREHADKAYDAAQNIARSAGRYARDNPGQAILIGLGGLLLASLLFRRR